MPVEWERIPDGVPEDFRALDGDRRAGLRDPARAKGRALVLDDVVVGPGPACQAREAARRRAVARPAGALSRRTSG
jgi:hypothetical protein